VAEFLCLALAAAILTVAMLLPNVGDAQRVVRETPNRWGLAEARAQLCPDLANRQVAAIEAWHRVGMGNCLREIKVPVLIATGTADIVVPPSNALKLVNAIPGAWLAQFNGGGHAFMAQYPRQLADLINSFLELG
jgi:pimeloyl-ACP methyl ester carboxylesterase